MTLLKIYQDRLKLVRDQINDLILLPDSSSTGGLTMSNGSNKLEALQKMENDLMIKILSLRGIDGRVMPSYSARNSYSIPR
jgi:hypothetical protein